MASTPTTLQNKTYGIGLKDKVGYALGDAAGLMTFALVGSFLQLFYTNVLYIDPKKITMLFLIARIWDAINDPMWGAIVDSRKPGKNGKFRPYLRWFSTPLALFGVLMFVKIPGLSEGQYLAFAYITYIGYGMLYTIVNIPYGSMASVITTDELERSSLSMFRSIGAGFGGLPGQILLPLFVYSTVAATGERVLDGNKLLIGVAVLGVLSIGVYQLCYKMTTERVVSKPTEKKVKVSKTVKSLFKNRPFIALCIASMLLIATQQYTQTTYHYLFLNYFKKPELYSLVTVFTYLPMALLLPVLQKIVRRFGKKEACAVGMAVALSLGARDRCYRLSGDAFRSARRGHILCLLLIHEKARPDHSGRSRNRRSQPYRLRCKEHNNRSGQQALQRFNGFTRAYVPDHGSFARRVLSADKEKASADERK